MRVSRSKRTTGQADNLPDSWLQVNREHGDSAGSGVSTTVLRHADAHVQCCATLRRAREDAQRGRVDLNGLQRGYTGPHCTLNGISFDVSVIEGYSKGGETG